MTIREIRDLFQRILVRPGVYGIHSFDEACAFLCGFHTATYHATSKEGIVGVFSSWLAPKSGLGQNLGFHHHVAEIAAPGVEFRHLDPEQDKAALQVFFDLLDDFLASDAARRIDVERGQ